MRYTWIAFDDLPFATASLRFDTRPGGDQVIGPDPSELVPRDRACPSITHATTSEIGRPVGKVGLRQSHSTVRWS